MNVPVSNPTPSSGVVPTPEEVPTQIPPLQLTESAQPTIQSTPTPVTFPVEPDEPGGTDWLLIAGTVVIGLIALVVIVLIVRWLRK